MDICALCKKQIESTSFEVWTTQEGEAVSVPLSDVTSVIAKTSIGNLEICESCYVGSLPTFFTPEDLAEIHHQFGLEYNHRQQFSQSRRCLAQARQISESADILASLAFAEDKLGHKDLAATHYRRALEIDPSHFMARENLKKL